MIDAISRAAPVTSVLAGTFAPPGWQKAIDNVLANGTYSELAPFPPTKGLKVITGPKDGTHHASYMNLWGGKDGSGKFIFDRITLVDEDWTLLPDGKLHMDQWLHDLSPDGASWKPAHKYMVRDQDGIVYEWGELPQSAGDPRASLAKLIDSWSKYQPGLKVAANDDQPNDQQRLEAARRAAQEQAPVLRHPNGLAFPRGGFGLRQ